jgi:hypothetical protein
LKDIVQFGQKKTGYQTVPIEAQCVERERSMHTWQYDPNGDKSNGQFKMKTSRKGELWTKEAPSDKG